MARIALVDDDRSFLAMMRDLMTLEGHQTLIQSRVDAAYAMISKHRPDLVVTDLRLEHPEGGWMLLDRMRLDPRTANIPVIVCSDDTHRLASAADYLREEGAWVLAKPFKVEQLIGLIEQLLDPERRPIARSLV
jgi:DNA-binding NtrC family response regulator